MSAGAADAIRTDAAAGRPVVPEVDYRDIRDGRVSEATRAQAIRRTGCAVVRGVFPASVASDWFAELGDYLEAEQVRGARGREAQPRQILLGAEGRQAADLQRLLVEAAGDGAPGPEARRDARASSTGCGHTRASSIPTGNAPMPTACAAASPATRRSASRRTWTPARSSAGSIPATSRSTSRSSPATGAATIRSTARTG